MSLEVKRWDQIWRVTAIALLASAVCLSSQKTFALDELHSLISARTAGEFSRRLNQQKTEIKENRICDVQLRTGKIPTACFRLLKMESFTQPSSLVKRNEKPRNLKWLETFCVRRASQSRDRRELAAAEGETALPDRCRTAARARAEDFNYIDESEHPADLFRRDHELD